MTRMERARATLVLQGFTEAGNGVWKGEHYHARIDTTRPCEYPDQLDTASFVIEYFTSEKQEAP